MERNLVNEFLFWVAFLIGAASKFQNEFALD